MKQPEILKNIKRIISAADPKAEAILYGSRARGDAMPDSDYDVLILIDGDRVDFKRETDITFPLYMFEIQEGIHISPLVRTRNQWNNPPIKTPFHVNVNNEGIKL
ncbi:MAG: nucleotidyltransferase domain-containing protein [Bacteroidales bacterium]|jgi:predicted nucleotidyltransferase|nr:nucleotidyltransferase domain-containing protein [Bacteroidales bacterium]